MKLFESYRINNKLSLKNRIMMPPVVTRLATTTGHVTDGLIDRYTLYAKGGAGIVVTEAVSVKQQKSGQLLRLNDDEFIPGLKKLTDRIHAETDAKIAPQIIHFLKIARSGYRQKVEDLTPEEVREIPNSFPRLRTGPLRPDSMLLNCTLHMPTPWLHSSRVITTAQTNTAAPSKGDCDSPRKSCRKPGRPWETTRRWALASMAMNSRSEVTR